MPYLKRKANYPQSSYGSYENPIMIDGGYEPAQPRFKKTKQNPPPKPPKVYVQRTPGGVIVAENHYYDHAKTATAISQAGT